MQEQLRKSEQGFTLIEALVATFLFVIVMASVSDVYLSTVKVNRRTDAIRTASENARYLVESMAKEVRNGQIDYYNAISPCSTSLVSPDYRLAIVNIDNDHLCFYLGDGSGTISSTGTNLWLVKNNLSPVKVNGNNVKITNLRFYIAPTYNPYTSGSRIEPRVTIVGNVQSNPDSQDNVIIPVQTTISIPAYDIAPGP